MNSDPCTCAPIDGADHLEGCVGEVFSERYASDTDRAPESEEDEPYDTTTAEPPLRPEAADWAIEACTHARTVSVIYEEYERQMGRPFIVCRSCGTLLEHSAPRVVRYKPSDSIPFRQKWPRCSAFRLLDRSESGADNRSPESEDDEPYRDPSTGMPALRPEERCLLLPFLRPEAADRVREQIRADVCRSTCHGWSCVFCARCGPVAPCALEECPSCGDHPELLREADLRRIHAPPEAIRTTRPKRMVAE